MDNMQRGGSVSFLGVNWSCLPGLCLRLRRCAGVCKYSGRRVAAAGSQEKSAQGRDAGRAAARGTCSERKISLRLFGTFNILGRAPWILYTRDARELTRMQHLPLWRYVVWQFAAEESQRLILTRPATHMHAQNLKQSCDYELMLEIFLESEAQRRWNLRTACVASVFGWRDERKRFALYGFADARLEF